MTTSLDVYKAGQRESWAFFAPLEAITTAPAASLVEFAGIQPGLQVLDVGCGTGVVAVSAANIGANVTGIDLSPALLERAEENAHIANVSISFREGDVEALPYPDRSFDFVVSQFGHMFAPRPEVAIGEMLRVLKPGGVIAFSTWPPELFTGEMFTLVAKYLPPPEGVAPPPLWGEPTIIRERLGNCVREVQFDRTELRSPSLSIHHSLMRYEVTAGPIIKLKATLAVEDPTKYEAFRSELAELLKKYRKGNTIVQHFLMTRAVKV